MKVVAHFSFPSAAAGGEGGARQRDGWGCSVYGVLKDFLSFKHPTRPPSASTLPTPAARRRESVRVRP
jgi:hypothetical protein